MIISAGMGGSGTGAGGRMKGGCTSDPTVGSLGQEDAPGVEVGAGTGGAIGGVTMIVEPLNSLVDHKGFFLTTCTEGLKLIQEVDNPHVRLLFDLYHEQVQAGNVIESAIPVTA